MASLTGNTATVTIDDTGDSARAISVHTRSFSIAQVPELADDSAFSDVSHGRVVGLVDTTISIEGYYDTTATTGSDTVLGAMAIAPGTLTKYTVAVSPDAGTITYTAECLLSSYTIDCPVDDLVTFSAEFVTADGAATGRA